MAKVKMNIQFEEDMKEYIEEQSERLGVSQSGFINLCIAQYKEQHDTIIAMNNIKLIVDKLDVVSRRLDRLGVK